MMLFHKNNIGKEVRLSKTKSLEEIISISKNKQKFRIKSEANGPVISDYTFNDIAESEALTISNDDGATWQDVALRYNKQVSPKDHAEVEEKKKKEKEKL